MIDDAEAESTALTEFDGVKLQFKPIGCILDFGKFVGALVKVIEFTHQKGL